jgi:hypothetical protein
MISAHGVFPGLTEREAAVKTINDVLSFAGSATVLAFWVSFMGAFVPTFLNPKPGFVSMVVDGCEGNANKSGSDTPQNNSRY